MNILTRTLLPGTVALILALSGCADDDADGKDTAGRSTTGGAPSTSAASAPLAITDHVLPADGLPGFTPQGQAEEEDLEAFAEAHDKSVADLRKSGFRSGSSLFFTGEGDDFAMSVAVAYADAAAAGVEAERLFASNTEGDPSIEVTPLDVPGVPGVKAALLEGADRGTEYAGVEIVFVDGTVLHEVFAVAEAARFDVEAVVESVTALYDEVAGRPTS